MNNAVIVAAKRTAIGSYGGQFRNISAVELGRQVVEATLASVELNPEEVDQVIFGNVLSAGLGQNVARQVAVEAGIPKDRTAFSVNMVCGSGLKAVLLAAQAVMLGDADVVVAGGTENMSQAPHVLKAPNRLPHMPDMKLESTMLKDGLTDAFSGQHMGVTAENIAERYGISRAVQDEFAAQSQQKAYRAQSEGRFEDEIVPVTMIDRKGNEFTFDQDEYIRPNSTAESLSRLRPAFKADEGTVTAGNASGINDGAAAIVVMSRAKADELGLEVLAEIKSYGTCGVDPDYMGMGPVPASQRALDKAGLTVEDLDLVEANEAFAVQSLAIMQELGLDPDIVNVNGGAIALGHPIGASGARVLVTLLHEMPRRQAKTGLATLCIGGGQGISLIVERP